MILCLVAFISQEAQAQVWNDSLPRKFVIWPAPSIGYQPETRLSFGLALFSTIRTGETEESSRLSNLELDILYTLNKQFILDLDHHLYLFNKNLISSGSNSLYHFPELFHGLGAETQDSLAELYHTNRIELDNSFLYKVSPNLYLGAIHRFQQLRNLEYQEGSLMLRDQITGTEGGITNGLGIGMIFDNRSNQLNPVPGHSFLEISWTIFSPTLGSRYSFNRIEIDARHYIKANKQGVFAFQAYGLFNSGDPPFRLTGMLGGSKLMRGYYHDRFRDRQYLVLQSEYRTILYKRLGVVVFGGLGNVGYSMKKLFDTGPKYSFGTGLRFQIDKTNRGNIRLDFAWGRKSSGIYLSYGECF